MKGLKKWELTASAATDPNTIVIIDPDIAWKLFSKSIRAEQVKEGISIEGNAKLGEAALTMVSVMA